jgi:hypothetical protein
MLDMTNTSSFEGDLADYVEMMVARHPRLSHRQASVEAGLANNAITLIVNRQVIRPRPDTLRKLAEKWGTDEDFYLMMSLAGHLRSASKKSTKTGQGDEMSAWEAERIIAALRTMTAEQRENVIRYVLERARGQSSE